MIIESKSKSEFKQCENSTTKKVLLNICDYLNYGLTDSNDFYRNWYVNQVRDYDKLKLEGKIKLGTVFYSTPLSYHIIANLVCVRLPKTEYNLIPFDYEAFKNCCRSLREYIVSNEIKEIHTPVFGSKILEGNWSKIQEILKDIMIGIPDLKMFVYK